MYDLAEAQNLEFYLHKRFVRDLSRLSARQLVDKYGTHLVAQYLIGPYMNLSVSAKASTFTNEEIKKIEAKLWDSKLSLNHETKQKIERNISDIALIYRQGGSNYSPEKPILSLSTFYQDGALYALDRKAWEAGIRHDNTFLMLAKDRQGLIPIPDLISDVPLKIKYLTGMIYQSMSGSYSAINYALCNPLNYQAFKYKGKYIRVALRDYADAMEVLHIGVDGGDILTESTLQNASSSERHKWDFAIQDNHLWTIKSRLSGKYLCTDGSLKALAEDSANTRFWLLNPIIPTADGNTRKASQLFIQPAK